MTSRKEIKKKAKQFYQSLHGEIHFSNIKQYIERMDWKVYFFNQEDSLTDKLIESIHLTEYAQSLPAFCYCSKNYQFVFIKENLTEEFTCKLLLHEAAHIILNHVPCEYVFSNTDAKQEKEAKIFTHYIKRLQNRKKNYVKTVLFLLLVGATLFLSMQMNHLHTLCYVTDTGERYHTKNCIFVRNKTNVYEMEIQEAEKYLLTPCQVCIGDDN